MCIRDRSWKLKYKKLKLIAKMNRISIASHFVSNMIWFIDETIECESKYESSTILLPVVQDSKENWSTVRLKFKSKLFCSRNDTNEYKKEKLPISEINFIFVTPVSNLILTHLYSFLYGNFPFRLPIKDPKVILIYIPLFFWREHWNSKSSISPKNYFPFP